MYILFAIFDWVINITPVGILVNDDVSDLNGPMETFGDHMTYSGLKGLPVQTIGKFSI